MKKKLVVVIGVLLVVVFGVIINVLFSNHLNRPVKDNESKVLTLSDFSSLDKGTSMEDVIETFGEPSSDIGSGLPIYLYSIEDGQMIILNFSLDQKVTKCTLQAKDGSKEVLFQE